MAANTYNIAKRSRQWAENCYNNQRHTGSSLMALSIRDRTRLAKSVERFMYEAYHEGFEECYRQLTTKGFYYVRKQE